MRSCAKRIATRDAQAFELMVDRHQARAYRLACSILGNEADARDVSQDAFLRLYESAGRFDGRSRFSTWFYRILVNLCIDSQRRNRWWKRLFRWPSPGDDPDDPGFDPPSSEAGPETSAMLESIGRGCDPRSLNFRHSSAPRSCCRCRKDLQAAKLRQCSSVPRPPRGCMCIAGSPS